MNRRMSMKIIAAASLSACGQLPRDAQNLKVVVVGAGIIGASISYHLAKAGARVTVIDKQGPATHASRGTFAWINATWAKQPHHYHSLNREGVASWRVLQQSLGIPVRWHGSLEWFDNAKRKSQLRDQIAEQVAWGEKARMIGNAELQMLEPILDFSGTEEAAFSENDGAVDPVVATHMLLDAAKTLGAKISYPCELLNVAQRGDSVASLTTTQGNIEADRLVLATGADLDACSKFAGIDVPQRTTPGLIVITKPMPRILNRIISAPGVHMHQRDDGRIVLGEQGGPPKNEAHLERLAGRPNKFPARIIAEQHFLRMLANAEPFAAAIAMAEMAEMHIGWRPLPIDGHPVLGFSPERADVYLAIMHSGVSLAPIIGQLAAYELINGTNIGRLEEYRPDRKFDYIKRY